MIRLSLPLIALAAAACSSPPPAVLPPAPTACGAEKLGGFVGRTRTDAISAEVARISGAKGIRWISPGTAVTMDYRQDRLNVDLDEKGVITGVRCG